MKNLKLRKIHFIIALPLFVLALILITSSSTSAYEQTYSHSHADSTIECPIDKEKFQSSAGINQQYLNQHVSFCGEGCQKAFNREPANYLTTVRCAPCNDDDAKKEISYTHEGVKYYFCGSGCKKKFEADAQKYIDEQKK
jgi:YHS domain-containing protein